MLRLPPLRLASRIRMARPALVCYPPCFSLIESISGDLKVPKAIDIDAAESLRAAFPAFCSGSCGIWFQLWRGFAHLQ